MHSFIRDLLTMMNLKTGVFSAFLAAAGLSHSDAAGTTSRLQIQVSLFVLLSLELQMTEDCTGRGNPRDLAP